MPELRFTLDGCATKKNSPQPGHRPSEAFVAWEDAAIPVLRRLRAADPRLPLSCPCELEIVVHYRGPEGDGVGYAQAVGDLLDGTRARFAHRKVERRLKMGVPFSCDYQIVTDDKLFNRGGRWRVVRAAGAPHIEVRITWD